MNGIKGYNSITNNSNNSHDTLDLVSLDLDTEKMNRACRCPLNFEFTPTTNMTCHVTTHACPTSSRRPYVNGRIFLVRSLA